MPMKSKKILGFFLGVISITLLLGAVLSFCRKYLRIDASENVEEDAEVIITDIYTVEDYLKFVQSVNKDNVYTGQTVMLYSDLDFSDYDNIPVAGIVEGESSSAAFNGIFDGNGCTISGIHMSNADTPASLFAKLTGRVKNLKIENSSFESPVCAAIAAENSAGAVLNCFVDAEVSGDIVGAIVGKNYGEVSNCVSSSVVCGENYGIEDSCYQFGNLNIQNLNSNLHNLCARYQDSEFLRWDASERNYLTGEKAELLDGLSARLIVDSQEFKLNAYYSTVDEQWFFALPANCGDEELFVEAVTTEGNVKEVKRNRGQETIEFSWNGVDYQVGFLAADNIDTLFVTLKEDIEYVHAHKKEEIAGRMIVLDADKKASFHNIKGFYGHGNDSWKAAKKSYNFKFDSAVDLLGMGADEDYVLLAGYRENSLMSYVVSGELSKTVGFDFAPEFRIVNLYVGGEYLGVYYLTEKMEIDSNRFDIGNLYEETKRLNGGNLEEFEQNAWNDGESSHIRYYYDVAKNPIDITGGYLLERDFDDYEKSDSRFTTDGKRSRIVLKRARFSSEEQVGYIGELWQNFEDGLFSEDGFNKDGKHYTEYIDQDSFAMQWLMYELSMESSIRSSVYYYKESNFTGDGLLHACYPWDVERSFVMKDTVNEFGSVAGQDEYWSVYYQHQEFRESTNKVWNSNFIPAINFMLDSRPMVTDAGVKNLVWYEENITDIHHLENSRWNASDLFVKCDMIRSILEIRKDVITEELENYAKEN